MAARRKMGFVYFVCVKETMRPFKIGFTRDANLKRRLSNLQMGSYQRLIVYSHIKTRHCEDLERLLHDLCESKRCIGEWFDITSRDVDKLLREHGWVP